MDIDAHSLAPLRSALSMAVGHKALHKVMDIGRDADKTTNSPQRMARKVPGTVFTHRMNAAYFAGFRTKLTKTLAMAWNFTAMTAGRVWSTTRGIANSVCPFHNFTILPDVAFLTAPGTFMPTVERCPAGCRTWIIVREWKFIAPYHYAMFAMWHDLCDLRLA